MNAPTAAFAPRRPLAPAIWGLAGGMLAIGAWFLPWFTMFFGPSLQADSSPLVQVPYALATGDPGGQRAWVALLVGLGLVALGILSLIRAVSPWQYAALQTAATFMLLLALEQMFAVMAVFAVWSGDDGPGVHELPQLGLVVVGCAAILSGTASVLAWRRL